MIPKWTDKWPIEPGYYWFYGRRFGKSFFSDPKPELSFVEVRLDSVKNPMYVTRGYFMYKAEGHLGLWLKADIPDLPEKGIKLLFDKEK